MSNCRAQWTPSRSRTARSRQRCCRCQRSNAAYAATRTASCLLLLVHSVETPLRQRDAGRPDRPASLECTGAARSCHVWGPDESGGCGALHRVPGHRWRAEPPPSVSHMVSVPERAESLIIPGARKRRLPASCSWHLTMSLQHGGSCIHHALPALGSIGSGS
jgi:hypothetical protein